MSCKTVVQVYKRLVQYNLQMSFQFHLYLFHCLFFFVCLFVCIFVCLFVCLLVHLLFVCLLDRLFPGIQLFCLAILTSQLWTVSSTHSTDKVNSF